MKWSIRSRKMGVVAFLFVALLPLLGLTNTASAAIWSGRATYHGYFTNSTGSGLCEYSGCAHQGYVLKAPLGGQALGGSINSVDSLIALLQSYNRGGNLRDTRGSAFIVHTMLGRSGDQANANGGINIRDADWTDVRARMNNATINWNEGWATSGNTYMQETDYDVALDTAGQSGTAIVFHDKTTGRALYALFRDCGNPDGNLDGLPITIPPTVVDCKNLNITPGSPTAQQSFRVTGSAVYSGGPSGPPTIVSTLTITPAPGTVSNSTTVSGSNISLSATTTVPNGGNYVAKWVLRVNETTETCTQNFFAYPPTEVSCGTMTVDPPNPEAGQPLKVSVHPTFTGGPPSADVSDATITVTGPGFTRTWQVPPDHPIPNGPTGGDLNFETPSFSLGIGTYTVRWSLVVNNVSPSPSPCGGTIYDQFDVMDYPYLEVDGGDVATGASFLTDTGQACGSRPVNNNAGISTWNKGSGDGYKGAGTQYAAFSRTIIQDFITNQGNTNGKGPTSLSFTNNDTSGSDDVPAGKYGGYFGAGPCVDYWAEHPVADDIASNTISAGSLTDGVHYQSGGNLTISGGSIPNGRRVTLFVDGDVNVTGDITYADTTWGSTADIPMFKLVVRGVIYINANVDNLDGVYVAVPRGNAYNTDVNSVTTPAPDAGTIVTCSNNFSARDLKTAANIVPCRNQLTVHGAFTANHIFFLRTNGSMSNGQPAEHFIYGPEMWLAPEGSSSINPAYEAIVGLPPVL